MRNAFSLSVLVPCYNEEQNLPKAIDAIVEYIQPHLSDYEILIIDDGSTDRTASIAHAITKKNKKIRLIRHSKNVGFGPTVRDGIAHATKEYVTQFHGDNDSSAAFLKDFILRYREADILSTYPADSFQRSYLRRILSKIFVVGMNILSGVKLRYYNGAFLCKTQLWHTIHPTSKGFAIYAEVKVRLIKRGHTYKEIPTKHVGRKQGVSKAVSWKSVLQTLDTVWHLLKDKT